MSKVKADLFDIQLLESEAQRRCGTAGVKVAYNEKVNTAAYDYKNHGVVLPVVRPGYEFDETEYRGMLIHEIGHANRRDVAQRFAGLDAPGFYARLVNAVEDAVLEREVSKEWYGDGVSLGLAHRRLVERDTGFIADQLEKGNVPTEDDEKFAAAYLMTQRARGWDKISRNEREQLEAVMPENVTKIVDDLEREGWIKRLEETTTCDEVFKFSTDLHKRLKVEDKDKDPEQESRNKAAADGKAGAGKAGAAGGKPAAERQESTTHWSDLLKQRDDHLAGLGGTIDYSGYHYDKQSGPTLLPTEVRSPRTGSIAPGKVSDLPIAGQLRILLLSEGKAKVLSEQTSGKIDKRKLARLALPVVPGSDSWRRSFRKRIPAKKLNTALSLLVDGSGSMGGTKMQLAAGAAGSMVKAIAGPLRIPTAVNGFSTAGHKNVMIPVKDFHEVVHPDDIAKRCMGFPMAGNADGEAVLWAADQLLKRREKRKVLIVLSDGMPSDGAHIINPGTMLSYAIEQARKRGVEVYGIGIEDRSVTNFYGKECKVISNANELGSALITTLGSKLHRK